MTYSDLLATIALIVSLATAVWTTYRAIRWARPVVGVSGEQWVGGSSTTWPAKEASFSIAITNVGDQATNILNAYWEIDRGDGMDFRFSSGREGIAGLFHRDGEEESRERFPFTLDRYGHKEWEFIIQLDGMRGPENMVRARPVVEFTSRKRREVLHGEWQTSQIGLEARRLLSED